MLSDPVSEYIRDQGFPGYAELRAQRNVARQVSWVKGSLIANSDLTSQGFSARVRRGGAYGFASDSTALMDRQALRRVVTAAVDNAVFLDGKIRLGLPEFAAVEAASFRDGVTEEPAVDQKDLIDFSGAIDAYLKDRFPDLISRTVSLQCLNMEKRLYTSDGIVGHTLVPRSILYVALTSPDKEGKPVDLYRTFGGYGTFGRVFADPEALHDDLQALYEKLRRKCEGVYAKPGIQTVILASDLAGILAHEAVGHTVEADFVQAGSVGGPNLGREVASPIVSLIDFAHTAYGKRCPVPVIVDDEGTPAIDQPLIENGVLTGFMHNKESAAKYGHPANGNARAYDFSDEPLIRMRNTCILPGKDKLADMIASVDEGYFFADPVNGQADSTGEFMFAVNSGFAIKDGKLTQPLRETTISGIAFDVLRTVTMIDDTLTWSCSGMCGKKQMIPVGMGGPAIKCRLNVGGRT